jgi:hypothetical protein
MAKQEENKNPKQGDIRLEIATANAGLNLDSSIAQIGEGSLTYALNAAMESFDSTSINYQNEPGNELCLNFPDGYKLIGDHFIPEKRKNIFFLVNPDTEQSEIGYMDNNDCQYKTLVNAPCLNFNIKHPIPKVVHRITNCTTEIYWTDGFNSRRYLDIENIPYELVAGTPSCDPVYNDQLDCNQLKLQPNFSIPSLMITQVNTVGNLVAGTYQFAIQYADSGGNELTSYYSITNPLPIADEFITSINFNYNVGKSIVVGVSNLDLTGQFQYFNLAVIKTINNISSVELIGTYNIEESTKEITYTGEDPSAIRLSISDIFEKFPYYDIAQDVTAVQDVLVWDNLTSIDRINYQSIANEITLGWETHRIPADGNYADELNAVNYRGYLRDEVYAFEIVFLLRNGKQTDGFHIPGRVRGSNESFPDVPDTNNDFIGEPDYAIDTVGYKPWWKVYNTGSVTGFSPQYISNDSNYKGPYQYGEFAYWESTEEYPCNNDVWGELAGQKIRHHKFPDVSVSPIIENGEIVYNGNQIIPTMQNDAIFPIGVRVNNSQISSLIQTSTLTSQQKSDIVGYKIVRGDRGVNRSIVAKGILRNVNKYTRDNEDYYFPNYPYNDLSTDPFILKNNNAWSIETEPWLIYLPSSENTEPGTFEYTSPLNGKITKANIQLDQVIEICSLTRPTSILGKMTIGPGNYDVYFVTGGNGFFSCGWRANWNDPFNNENISGTVLRDKWIQTGAGQSTPGTVVVNVGDSPYETDRTYCSQVTIELRPEGTGNEPPTTDEVKIGWQDGFTSRNNSRRSPIGCKENVPQTPITELGEDILYRQIFNSPETSFGQPFLGTVLKLESVLFGAGKAHFVQVEDNAKYKLLSKEAQIDALDSSRAVAEITDFNAGIMFTVYQSYLTIYINGITRKNYAMSFNSRANYDYSYPIDNNVSGGIKQRNIELTRYLIPGVQSLGPNELSINNWNRESSVFIKTVEERESGHLVDPLPFPSDTPSLLDGTTPRIVDKSRLTIGDSNACSTPEKEQDISVVSYYASMKNIVPNQWGQIYSYQTIDTGYQIGSSIGGTSTVFGGDTFISRFTFKTKLPFFIDNRVGAPDDSDIFYDEIGNIGYPKYWHSARSILEDYDGPDNIPMRNLISYKAHNFDCPNDPALVPVGGGSARTFYDGYFYLFAYGIPNFYCESSYNVDLRQAFNNKEGDYWPHVSSGIPDDWFQEKNVSIAQDNTYYYNVTFSKQNKENVFTHLPPDWKEDFCFTYYPFRTIYSDPATVNADNRVNNWLVYRALSFYDFPQNYGALTSLDGIQNKAILARFENKSLLYNNLLTIDTSNPQAAYLGNSRLFDSSPPIDFAETDLGYVGSQNKFLLKIPQGQVTVDALRGQIFLISGTQALDLTGHGSGVNKFMKDHLPFEILKYFPTVNTDNHYNGIGLHGVYDNRFERIIITKIDYIPINPEVKYNEQEDYFYIINNEIEVEVYFDDLQYFCNKSWTISFDFHTRRWISFHSYIPNFYIGENNFFYSGLNKCCTDIDVEVIAGPIDPVVPFTTTTTTTSAPLFTTTTTTTAALDCELSGGSFIETDCQLEGTGIILVPPTTTTTICSRPSGLTTGYFMEGYEVIEGGTIVDSTGSQEDACNAAIYISTAFPAEEAIPINITVQYSGSTSTIGTIVYSGTDSSCTFVADGWYSTQESFANGYVFQVVNGIIVDVQSCAPEVTTTTTTTASSTCNVNVGFAVSIFDICSTSETNPVTFTHFGECQICLVATVSGSIITTLPENGFFHLKYQNIQRPFQRIGLTNTATPTGSCLECSGTTTTTTTIL